MYASGARRPRFGARVAPPSVENRNPPASPLVLAHAGTPGPAGGGVAVAVVVGDEVARAPVGVAVATADGRPVGLAVEVASSVAVGTVVAARGKSSMPMCRKATGKWADRPATVSPSVVTARIEPAPPSMSVSADAGTGSSLAVPCVSSEGAARPALPAAALAPPTTTDSAADTISILYALTERTYVDGVETGKSTSCRVATLDASAWPATSVVADARAAFVGAPATASELTVSRDGTLVAYKNAGADPYLTVALLECDAQTVAVTWRTDLAHPVADVTPLGYGWAVDRAGGFSPDNSQLVIDGLANTAAGLDNPRPSVLLADATSDAPPVDVDGDTDRQAGSSIWSP